MRDWLAQTNAADLAPLRWHTVKKGETLLAIARKLKVSRTDLAEANYLSIRSKVKVGQQLIIPREPQLLLAARSEPPAPPVETRKTDVVVAAASVRPGKASPGAVPDGAAIRTTSATPAPIATASLPAMASMPSMKLNRLRNQSHSMPVATRSSQSGSNPFD